MRPPRPVASLAAERTKRIPNLKSLDVTLGLTRVAGNRALYRKLLDRFRETQRHAISDVRVALAEGKRRDASLRAHSLRGVAGNIGAIDIQRAAEALELMLADEGATGLNAATTEQLIQILEALLTSLLAELDQYFATAIGHDAAISTASGTDEEARAALTQLRNLLSDCSGDAPDYFDGSKNLLSRLIDAATMERLSAHIRGFDFDEALLLLKVVPKGD